MKAGITIDNWKLSIFERHLKQAGYEYINKGDLVKGTSLLTVETKNIEALAAVIEAATVEASKTVKKK